MSIKKIKEIKIREDDGSYSDPIPMGADAINVDTLNGSNLEQDLININNSLSNNENKIISVDNKVNGLASGSPLAASSISGMTDTTKIYVNTTDGHWYYYNNNQWNDGGIYQSSRSGKPNEVLYYDLESILQDLIDIDRGTMIDLSTKNRIPGFLYHNGKGPSSGADNSNNGMYGHYIFNDLVKGDMIYILYGLAVAQMPLYILRRKSNGSVIQTLPETVISGSKNYIGILVEIPEDDCELIIQDTTANSKGLLLYENPKFKSSFTKNPSSNEYRNRNKINLGDFDNKIIECLGTSWEEIKFKENGIVEENITYVYNYSLGYLEKQTHSTYDTCIYPLNKGETYLFTGADLYLVPGFTVVNKNMQLQEASKYYSSSITSPTGSSIIYTCKEDNLNAYISLPHNIEASTLTYFAKLKDINRQEDKITLLRTIENYYLQGSSLGSVNNLFNQKVLSSYVRGECLQYLMNKGISYKAIAYNWAEVAGIVITDLDYNIIYASSNTNIGSTATQVEYEWTAECMGYIFLHEHFKESINIPVSLIATDKEVNYQDNNPLFQKIAIFNGDSICQGDKTNEYSKYGWAGRIGTKNEMEWKNYAVGGGTVTTETYYYTKVEDLSTLDWSNETYYKKVSNVNSTTEMYQIVNQSDYNSSMTLYIKGSARHWESTNIEQMYNEYPNADYIILESSLNDGFNNVPLGEITDNFNNTYITTNFSSAVEYMLQKAISFWPTAKIGVIIPYRVKNNIMSNYHDKTRKACEKWGIPYLDLEKISGINPYVEESLTTMFKDTGVHINSQGYDFINEKIENWMKTL